MKYTNLKINRNGIYPVYNVHQINGFSQKHYIILRNLAKANFSFPIIYPDLKMGAIDFKFRQIIQYRRDEIIIKIDNDRLKH